MELVRQLMKNASMILSIFNFLTRKLEQPNSSRQLALLYKQLEPFKNRRSFLSSLQAQPSGIPSRVAPIVITPFLPWHFEPTAAYKSHIPTSRPSSPSFRSKTETQEMRISSSYYGFLLLCTILALHALVCSSATVDFGGIFPLLQNEGELLGSEFAMESEISRRILATTRYISYGALRRNTVPCSRRGASYYNCRPGAQANPYSRGCSAITRCRR